MEVNLRVLRYNPETDSAPHFEDYKVEADPTDRILDLLHYVKWYQDGSLAVRRSCAHGICGSDAVVINGVNALACKVLVRDLEQPIVVEPIRGLPVHRDLIVDMEPFFAGYRAVKPWLIVDETEHEPARERYQSPEDRERLEILSTKNGAFKCRTAFNCSDACPRGIKVTQAIQEVKRAALFESF